jgi:DNA ligase-1
MRYSKIVEIYEQIEATTKRLEMTDLLVRLIKETPKEDIDKIVYLTAGILYPDFMGIELGVAEKLGIKAIAEVSGKPDHLVEEDYKRTGDLGITAEKFSSGKRQATLITEALTVKKIYETFDRISRATGPGSIEQKVRLLCGLLTNASGKESRYVIRTAVGQLRLGVADMTILDALAVAYGGGKEAREAFERAYNLSSDLGYVAKAAALGGLREIEKFEIAVGRPIRPMLAERLSDAKEILEKLGGTAALEYKYDGLRIQAHITANKTTLFSRRLENITSQFPDAARYMSDSLRVKNAILEGECVAVDPNTDEMLPFQAISQRRGRKHDIQEKTEEVPISLFMFDLLFLNSMDYTNHPYPERRQALAKVVRETERVKISRQTVVDNYEELDKYMAQAISDGCEGIMVKSLGADSVYKAGARGFHWIKYKREYKSEMTDTADLVAVGAFAGRGKRAGSFGALLLSSYNDKDDVFETVCKCGSGFTDDDLKKLPEALEPHRVSHKHARVKSKMIADVWFAPSFVLEVIGAEITLSPIHTCQENVIRQRSGLAIRFPRFTGNYRTDKAPEDANTSLEILEMYKAQLKKIDTQAQNV